MEEERRKLENEEELGEDEYHGKLNPRNINRIISRPIRDNNKIDDLIKLKIKTQK